jgi:amino acid adenylation domain-containing protein
MSSAASKTNTFAETVSCLFEVAVENTPNAHALVYRNETLTYAELNRRSNSLARYLLTLGVGPESLVAVSMSRSVELVVAFLAILKAGGAYVPIDPAYPAERQSFLLEDASPSVILTQSHVAEGIPASQARIVCLDRDGGSWAHYSNENLDPSATREHLAYVMYTSGSTGRPKGVCIRHAGVVRLVVGQNYFSVDPGDRFLQSAPISFDASTFEIWAPLLHGATLVLYPQPLLSADTLAAVIRTERISTLWLTPSLFNPLVDEDPTVLAPVKQLIIGGEPLSPRHVHRALKALPNLQIINGYGPTENTDFTCCYRVPPSFSESARSVPVGQVLRGDEIFILDENLSPVPPGTPGELCISGEGLARGYHRRPGLTARSFLPNAFSTRDGARLYRSGDLARILADGNVELLGRIDDQVKVRGFRIELGEVTVALLRHPAVRQAAAAVCQDHSGANVLVAYVVLSPGEALSVPRLRDFLSQFLPAFMLPSGLMCLDDIPLTPNGKINRSALPDWVRGQRHMLAGQYAPPNGETEQLVADVWRNVLGVAAVGADDSFFDLGGTSLLIRQVQVSLQQRLGREIPITCLFEYVTVRAFAGYIGQTEQPFEQTTLATTEMGKKSLADRVQRRLKTRRNAL